jgi:hypothetical protein
MTVAEVWEGDKRLLSSMAGERRPGEGAAAESQLQETEVPPPLALSSAAGSRR